MVKLFANILRHLIWVCTVCQLPFLGSPDYNELINVNTKATFAGSAIQSKCFGFPSEQFTQKGKEITSFEEISNLIGWF